MRSKSKRSLREVQVYLYLLLPFFALPFLVKLLSDRFFAEHAQEDAQETNQIQDPPWLLSTGINLCLHFLHAPTVFLLDLRVIRCDAAVRRKMHFRSWAIDEAAISAGGNPRSGLRQHIRLIWSFRHAAALARWTCMAARFAPYGSPTCSQSLT